MTTNQDLDRILATWLGDGPTSAPDRVLDGLPDRIGQQSQRPGWLVERLRPVAGGSVRLLAAAATLVVVVAAGTVLLGGGIGPGNVPSPTPSPTPTPTPSPMLITGSTTTLAAGTHAYTANGARTTVTVPNGWHIQTFGSLDFALAPVEAAAGDTVRVFYDMRIASKDVTCPEQAEPGIGPTAADVIGDIVANPGVAATSPEPITIGDLDGMVVDVAMVEDWTGTCPFDPGQPGIPLIVDTVAGAGPFWGLGPETRQRIIVLDRSPTHNVVLVVESADGTTFDDLVAAAMPVLETLTVE